ncbi:Histone H4 [Colletotrichum orbiculare MAFF 240422]|uniref:Histone H4 n=1 Tax=Colletotrichum orbiculare (strain 104-T / ATCC 96160 / CBS 514.97 / LARS 414 / MAFF 240422) TaxID=1213857 RepID=A0A484F969_COLOR|nr:Histone H4 [Colletotrichum orbiculare MAFF 240422]
MPPSSQPTRPKLGGPGRKGVAGRVPPGGGKGKSILIPGGKRHRKIVKDTIHGITKPAIRRIARRGGVKRISTTIYGEARDALKARLTTILGDCIKFVEYRNAKTVTVLDVIHALRRLGTPIYGFDPDTFVDPKDRKSALARGAPSA